MKNRMQFLRNGNVRKDEKHYWIRVGLEGNVYGEVRIPYRKDMGIVKRVDDIFLSREEVMRLYNPPSRLERMRFPKDDKDDKWSYDSAKDTLITCYDVHDRDLRYFEFITSWVDRENVEEREYIDFVEAFLDRIVGMYLEIK